MIRLPITVVLCAGLATAALAQPPAAPAAGAAPARAAAPAPAPTPMKGVPIPPALAPAKVSGVGINVVDLEGMKAWYMTTLGLKLVRTYERNGAAYEYILSMGDVGGNLALIRGARQPGSTTYGRLILQVPDSVKLAEHLTANGIPARRVAEGAYFIRDPEGNNVELYTPPPPAAPAAPAAAPKR